MKKPTWKRVLRLMVTLAMIGLLGGLAGALYNTYDAYTQMMVVQQQQHLLITARAVSQNLSLYLSEQLRDVDILTRTPGFLEEFDAYYDQGENRGLKEYVLSYILSQSQGISRVYLLDRDGNEVFRYNQYPFLEEFDETRLHLDQLAASRQTRIGSAFCITQQHYGLTLVNSIMSGNDYVGAVVSVLDMEALYQEYIAPLEVQGSVDIVVKNETGTVIMHPDQAMLTFNCFWDIQELESLPQYESLREMLELQYSTEEGTAIYRSFTNGIQPSQEMIAAFSRMNLGGTSWYISAVMPYSQVMQMVSENLGRFAILGTAVLALVTASVLIIYGLQKNRQKLKIEAGYLKNINRTLEQLHESREQVRHYQKLQTLGALAGGIVHEFNNLLTPVMGYSEFLKKQLGPENPYYEDIDEIYKAGARAKEIVEQILPFSRRETDSTQYGPVSLDAVVRDALKMIRMILPSSIRLETRLSDSGVNVYGSTTQLHQVLLNLCSNAYQAMERTGGVLTVAVRPVARAELPAAFRPLTPGEFIQLRVSDTGCGIAPEDLPHVFDPFFTTKKVGEGTGLGLSVVQNILISHGGFIEVQSEMGRGSTFLVYLPVTQQSAGSPGNQTYHASVLGRGALLLVDDEARVTRYLKRRLLHQGYQVDAFTDPEAALEAFRQTPERWQLLIADETMPKYKGTVLSQCMKALNSRLSVILITGLLEEDAIRLQNRKEIDDILLKPVDFDALMQAVERLLQEHDGASDRSEEA